MREQREKKVKTIPSTLSQGSALKLYNQWHQSISGFSMSNMKDLALWMYGDVSTGNGFWYSHEIGEIAGLAEEQLFWVPDPNGLCILWHVGHIVQRERLHIGRFLQGIKGTIIPEKYEIFNEWCSAKKLRDSIDSEVSLKPLGILGL